MATKPPTAAKKANQTPKKGPPPIFDFMVEKVATNLLIWMCAYLFIGKFILPKLNLQPLDLAAFLDWKALVSFLVGVSIAMLIAFGIDRLETWFFKKCFEEEVVALVNAASIAIVAAPGSSNWLYLVTFGLVGYLVAWRFSF